MAKNSAIQWTHHTFNPWWGCVKVSPGCANCYADTFAKRVGQKVWGKDAPRRFFGDKHWAEPLKWDKVAEKAGERHRVFCASMADVFEDRPDLEEPRQRLFKLIDQCKNLDWLLLTKRPENIIPLMEEITNGNYGEGWNFRDHMPNVWLGTTCEDQTRAQERIPHLLANPAVVNFLSCEPLIGPLDLTTIGNATALAEGQPWLHPLNGLVSDGHGDQCSVPEINWIICGGESGPKARPMELEWARRLYAQCHIHEIAFLMKQLGGVRDARGDIDQFPEDLRVRQFPR